MERFNREISLIGQEKFNKIKAKTVALIGLGGVGGYALECLIRGGINNIIIVDFDTIDITNLNRQILTLTTNLGQKKIDIAEKRILDINPNVKIIKLDICLGNDNLNELFKYNIDYVIDACDTINTKKILIKECINKKIKIISCMGTGNKLHPELLEICDIRKTSYDPLAKVIRKYVNDETIKEKVMVVASKEEIIKHETKISSISYVPASAGILCASYVINDIIKET